MCHIQRFVRRGVDFDQWTDVQATMALSHGDDVKVQLAFLVHECSLEYTKNRLKSNRVNKYFDELEIEANASTYEPTIARENVNDEKRSDMQMLSYTDAEIEDVLNQPDDFQYQWEVREHMCCKDKLFKQIFFLATIDSDKELARDKRGAEAIVAMLTRLLGLDHSAMGRTAVTCIKQSQQYWKSVAHLERRAAQGKSINSGNEPQSVDLHGKTFPDLMEEQHWIKIPVNWWGKETLPAATINNWKSFPPTFRRNLRYFARTLGFDHAEQRDDNGCNIFHHLFRALRYCGYAIEIAIKAFTENEPVLKGDYMAAMSHMNAQGWTPLHVLCSGSDEWGHQAEIITLLLESNTVELDFFDTMLNAKVIVFLFSLVTYVYWSTIPS